MTANSCVVVPSHWVGAAMGPSVSTPAAPRSSGLCWRWKPWRDVLVAMEQVGRVVAGLDRRQPLPGRSRVGLAEPLLALVDHEADLGARVPLLPRRREL